MSRPRRARRCTWNTICSTTVGCAECYGVEILAQTGEAQCYAGIPRITMRGTRIFTLIDQLAYFAVTPDSLQDVLQDWL